MNLVEQRHVGGSKMQEWKQSQVGVLPVIQGKGNGGSGFRAGHKETGGFEI